MAVCPSCRAEVPDAMLHCGQCGSSMKPPAPSSPTKRTMMGLTGVDQKELQRAIEAARAATAAGETAKKPGGGRRTMMGVAAVSAQAPRPVAPPAPVDDTWAGEPSKTVPSAAPEIDEGWDLGDAPVVPAAARSTPAAPSAMSSPVATRGPQSAVRGTVAFEATGLPVTATKPATATAPAPRASATVAFEAVPASDPARALRGTAEFGATDLPPATGPATKAPGPIRAAVGLRGTALLGAMAEPPAAAATERPTTGSRPKVEPTSAALSTSSAPLHPAALPDSDGPAESDELEMADTIAGRRAGGESLSPARTTGSARAHPTDPLADTIQPGTLQREDVLKGLATPSKQTSTGTEPVVPSMPSSATTSQVGIKKVAATTPPPFLASKALVEDMFPTEPDRGKMRVLLIVVGVLLPLCWLVPGLLGALGPGLVLPWTAVATGAGDRVLVFLTPILGLLLLVLGIVPIPYRVRALGALVLGLAPLLASIGGLGPVEATRGWPGALLTIGMVVLPGALLHRANYRASGLSRVLVALGMVLMLAWMFVPGGSEFLPTMLAGFSSMTALPRSIVMLVLMVLVAASLLAYMTSATTGGSGVVARLLIVARPALVACSAIALAAGAGVNPVTLAASAVLLFGCNVIACFGMAQSLAALEERPRITRV